MRCRCLFPLPLCLGLILGLTLGVFCATSALAQGGKRDQTEAELKAIQAQIARVRERVERDQLERDRYTRDLRSAEVSVAGVRSTLEELRRERAARAARRAALAEEKQQREAALNRERGALAGQMRAAYLIGREEPLKLLLNQKDPTRVGRTFAYYSYFGRARAEQIDRIESHVEQIAQLEAKLVEEEQQLAQLENTRLTELERLEDARQERAMALKKLAAEARTREQSLARLQRQQRGLEKLLRDLERAIRKVPKSKDPVDPSEAFARLRGKLAWPVAAGRIVARFGQTRAGGVKWNGILLATDRGAPVRAVHSGRVVYADWLPGLGLLTIVDHGEGYLSLYGHNERLYKAVGERVTSGDTLGAAGDSGGRGQPELYFEIRRRGKPLDPSPWFRGRQP